jgi:hypothetical protein
MLQRILYRRHPYGLFTTQQVWDWRLPGPRCFCFQSQPGQCSPGHKTDVVTEFFRFIGGKAGGSYRRSPFQKLKNTKASKFSFRCRTRVDVVLQSKWAS